MSNAKYTKIVSWLCFWALLFYISLHLNQNYQLCVFIQVTEFPVFFGPRTLLLYYLERETDHAVVIAFQIGFAAADAVTGLKLIEEGVPKEHLAMMAVPMVPIDIVLPIIITRYMSSQRPLNVLLKGMPFRYVSTLFVMGFCLEPGRWLIRISTCSVMLIFIGDHLITLVWSDKYFHKLH